MEILSGNELKYVAGMKYQLHQSICVQTNIFPDEIIRLPFLVLFPSGVLVIEIGFSWDGASGPTYDSKNSFLAGLIHDALYRFIQQELLDMSWKGAIDNLFHETLKRQGMSSIRAYIWYQGVDDFGKSSAATKKKVHVIKLK